MAERARDAFDVALAALRRRERATAELAAWLTTRGYGSEEIEGTIGRLTEVGELDDERFARRYAEDKRQLAGWGPDRISKALEGRGVAREHIEAALVADDPEALLERAVTLLGDRGMVCESGRERERALGLLVRRGYPLELAYEAVREVERLSDAA